MPLAAEKLHPKPTSQRPPSPCPVRILADDLTGACDSAVAFASAHAAVRVWLGPAATTRASELVQAFNTASRELSRDLAEATVTTAATDLLSTPENTLIFKKIDSCARGPIAAEVLAAHHTLGTRAILLTPSFPVAGRTVRNGILYVQNEGPGRATTPLLTLFQPEAHPQIAHIRHPSEIPDALADGKTILLCDASYQAELDALAALDIPNLLYAGSSGLARALAFTRALRTPTPAPIPHCDIALTICGTQHPVTTQQMEHFDATMPLSPRLRILADAAYAPAILAAFERDRPEALVLTGGDTALLVLNTLGAHSILVRGEFAPGIPWGIIQGGRADGRIVVTKSGGFGNIATLTHLIHTLRRKAA